MKTAYTVYCDLHIFSPIEMMAEELINLLPSPYIILNGDIVDRAGCKKSEVDAATALYRRLKKAHGDNYVDGNHERAGFGNVMTIRNTDSGKAIFAHGDLESNLLKWNEYRNQPHGAGFFKRKFIIPFIREAEEIIDRKPKKDFLDNVAVLCADWGAKIFVAGHFHVKEKVEVIHKGIRVIILPRGKTTLLL